MMIYRKLCNSLGEIRAIWLYDSDTGMESQLWSFIYSLKLLKWQNYQTPSIDYKEIDITQDEAEALMFLENI